MGDTNWRYPAGRGQAAHDLPASYLPRESPHLVPPDLPAAYPSHEVLQPLSHDVPGYFAREGSQLDDRIGPTWRQQDSYVASLGSFRNGASPYGARGLSPDLYARAGSASRLQDGAQSGTPIRSLDTAQVDPSLKLPEHLRGDAAPNTIFVEGLPADCTRREVAHIFRPFIGFKQLRIIHKEPRVAGGEPYVLCFVEFSDAKCALTALNTLQGYNFDESEDGANALKLQLTRFPGTQPKSVGDLQAQEATHR